MRAVQEKAPTRSLCRDALGSLELQRLEQRTAQQRQHCAQAQDNSNGHYIHLLHGLELGWGEGGQGGR